MMAKDLGTGSDEAGNDEAAAITKKDVAALLKKQKIKARLISFKSYETYIVAVTHDGVKHKIESAAT